MPGRPQQVLGDAERPEQVTTGTRWEDSDNGRIDLEVPSVEWTVEARAVEVGSRVDDPPGSGRIRVQFVASQLVGVVMARYILELEPFKSLPVDQIAETIAPNLQRYLTGDLPGLG